MRLSKENNLYVWYGRPENRHLPKEAGFSWNPDRKRWETPHRTHALRLIRYADPALKEELEAEQQQTLEASRATDAAIEIPAPPGLAYLGYQRAGVAFALERPAALIADEQGLGKTIQVLGLINARKEIRRVLVVCPVSVKLNWVKEARRWLVRPHTTYICQGSTPKEEELARAEEPGQILLAVINYEILHAWALPLRQRTWDLLVADEAHYVKDHRTRRSIYLYGGKAGGKRVEPIPAHRRLALTGTPIVNRPIELYNIVHWLKPDLFPSVIDYGIRYCAGHRTEYGWDFDGASNLEELQRILRSNIMIRRLKTEVLQELPRKFRQVIEISAETRAVQEEQRGLARIQERLVQLRVGAELAKATEDPQAYRAALSALWEAQRAAFQEIAQLRHRTALAKLPYLLEHLENLLEEGHKAIFFAHHHDVLQAVQQRFADRAVLVYGETDGPARQQAVERFQTDPTVQLFIGGLTATAEGITLTAASRVVFGELDWRPGKMMQAEDRAHRIGQQDNVLVQMVVLESSIDARIAQALVRKMEIIERALDQPLPAEEEGLPEILEDGMPATQDLQPEAIAQEAAGLEEDQIAAIHQGLRRLIGGDQAGLSRCDAEIGHRLAEAERLTPRQAVLGLRLLRKYPQQLPPELLEAATGRPPAQ